MRMLVPGPVRSHFKNLLLNFTPSELKNFIKYNYSIKNNNMTINEKRLTIRALWNNNKGFMISKKTTLAKRLIYSNIQFLVFHGAGGDAV